MTIYTVTQTRSKYDDRAFAAASPRLWSSLPPHLRDADLPYSRSVTKYIFVWIVGPWHSVNYFNCTILEITLLSYFTYL